jgi:hypothetical protein
VHGLDVRSSSRSSPRAAASTAPYDAAAPRLHAAAPTRVAGQSRPRQPGAPQ